MTIPLPDTVLEASCYEEAEFVNRLSREASHPFATGYLAVIT